MNELDDYTDLYTEVLYDIYSNHDGDFSQMDEDQIDVLFDLWDHGTYAGTIAKYLLSRYEGYEYEWDFSDCSEYYSTNPNKNKQPKSELKNERYEIKIYPNPTNDILNIELPDNENCHAEISICDLSGRVIFYNHFSNAKNQISVASFSEGTYFIKVVTNNKITLNKFVVMK